MFVLEYNVRTLESIYVWAQEEGGMKKVMDTRWNTV